MVRKWYEIEYLMTLYASYLWTFLGNFNVYANVSDDSCEYDLIGDGCSVSFDFTNTGINASVFINSENIDILNQGDSIGVFYIAEDGTAKCAGYSLWEIPITISKETSEIGRIVDIDGNFVFSSGIAFVATFQGDVAALDTRSGRFIWKEKTSTANDLLSSRGKIILIDEKDQVLAYSQNSGNLEWFNKDFFLRELTSPNRLKSLIVYGDFQAFQTYF